MSNLTQTQIDAMMQGKSISGAPDAAGEANSAYTESKKSVSGELKREDECFSSDEGMIRDISKYLSSEEIDALGELGNICIGTSATTLYALMGRKVTITTPQVGVYNTGDVLASYKLPYIAINVEFTDGIHGNNLLILKDYDAALITDLLMGGSGDIDSNVVLSEIHLSAMGEVMNQMMGSAATAMSDMMGGGINISPPIASRLDANERISKFFGEDLVVKISFDMEIEGLLKSKLLQIMTLNVAKELIGSVMHLGSEQEQEKPAQEPANQRSPKSTEPVRMNHPGPQQKQPEQQPVKTVRPVKYQNFDEPVQRSQNESASNFDLINDIPLQVTVELGKTKKNLNDVLNFGIGSIIVLDKVAGELVDVIANGKKIARGEVVVIDENYGVRLTEIVRSANS